MIYSNIKQNRGLYGGVTLIALFLVISATGGGLFDSQTFWMNEWQHMLFRPFCHQDPGRSFWLNGQPMAVCSRCYGIYTAFAVLWLSIPLMETFIFKIRSHSRKLLLCAVVLNVVDVVGNLLGFWQNTLISRYILGFIIGGTVVLLLADEFLKTKSITKRELYGFDRTI